MDGITGWSSKLYRLIRGGWLSSDSRSWAHERSNLVAGYGTCWAGEFGYKFMGSDTVMDLLEVRRLGKSG